MWNKNKKEGSDRNERKTRQTNTTVRIKNNTTKMVSIHMTALRKMKNKNKTELVEYGSHKTKKRM